LFRILVAEDDPNTRKLLGAVLRQNGFVPILAQDGVAALEILAAQQIDLTVLDLMMPRMDGYELTRQIRLAWETMPILMLTAKQTPQDKHTGFLVGTDDYLTKPFDEQELIFRIHALLRRAKIAREHSLQVGDARLDYDALTVSRTGEVVQLPQKEFNLLFKLLSYPNMIFTRLQLMDEIWGLETETDDHTLNVHINRLRTRFRDWPQFEIITVRGLGYKAVRRA
jgi:DNA-binding response OmpR family regulator